MRLSPLLRTRNHNGAFKITKKTALPLLLLGLGLVLIISQSLLNSCSYLASVFTIVNHPKIYSFRSFDTLLGKYVKDGLVDYKQLKDSQELKLCLKELSKTSPDRLESVSDQLCYWINAHNLLILKCVTDKYPIESVKELGDSLSFRKFVVGGKPCSIQYLQQKKLDPLIKKYDSRAFFLVSSGARGYPQLINHAINSSRLETDMGVAAYSYFNDPLNAYYDDLVNVFYVSPLLRWNKNLFTFGPFASPFAYANAFMEPLKRAPFIDPRLQKRYMDSFDWRLNDRNQFAENSEGKEQKQQ